MSIYSPSYASFSNPIKFSANSTAAQNSGNGAFATVAFATEEYDTGSNYSTPTFTAPVAGFYYFSAGVSMSGSNARFIISIFKNGSEAKRGTDVGPITGNRNGAYVSSLVQCAAGDTVDIRSLGSPQVALSTTAAEVWFNGYLVSTL